MEKKFIKCNLEQFENISKSKNGEILFSKVYPECNFLFYNNILEINECLKESDDICPYECKSVLRFNYE